MARPRVSFNHAIVYVRDVDRALRFYRDGLGFRVIESMPGYARLRGPGGSGTLALHRATGPRGSPSAYPVVLYFEVRDLAGLARRLRRRGVPFDQAPKRMPWGWDHAYLRDPDGHSVSLYWAGAKRFRKTPPMAGA